MNDALLLLSAGSVLLLFGFWLGWSRGVKNERERCERLCHQSMVVEGGRLSGSVGWVWNAVASGRDELLPADEFFGPRR